MSRWNWWSRRSQVERVDIYTRQSLYVLLWMFTLLFLVGAGLDSGDHQAAGVVLVVGALLLSATATLVLRDVMELHPALGPIPWGRVGPFLGLAGLCVVGALFLPEDLRIAGVGVVWGCLGWALGGLRDRRALALLMVVLLCLPLLGKVEWYTAAYGLIAGSVIVFTVRTSLWLIGVVRDLERARGAQAALAVAEERLRFSRDLHDVMGRRLSAIAVKSELAATLADRSDPGAAAQMLEVRGVAHEAMREARELARGYRTTDLAQELEGSRSLLESAGISVELAVDDVPPGWHEAAAWVVREAVTNVLRHSAATAVAIRYAGSELAVVNDGVVNSRSASGSGLAGLRERLAPLGAGLTVTGSESSFAVVATLPGRGPAEPA
ncbi:MAG TPA: histidine kinase [Nocardioides sp.]|nr:histidine kinase [Nocardioides sp.]